MSLIEQVLPQSQYVMSRQEQAQALALFKSKMTAPDVAKLDSLTKNRSVIRTTDDHILEVRQNDNARKALAKQAMVALLKSNSERMAKAGVTTGTGFNFLDLRGPQMLLYPYNTPIRNAMERRDKVNAGTGTAAHWQATRNPGFVFAGVTEGNRAQVGTPDSVPYIATYKEIGGERNVSFTAQAAGEGFTDVMADEHLRGLQTLFLQEEAMLLHGNAGTSTGNNGFQLGTAPTPAVALSTTQTTALANGTNVSVAVVLLTAQGFPSNNQYGYVRTPTVASGLTPQYSAQTANGATQVINGGTSAISAMSAVVPVAGGKAPVATLANVPAGAFGFAWYVNTTDATNPSFANAKLAGITTVPSFAVTAAAAGTQTGAAAGLDTDHSMQPVEFDGLLTYTANCGTWQNLNGASLTSDKQGGVKEVEAILYQLFEQFQTGVTTIWGSADAVLGFSQAVRYSGVSATGYQVIINKDEQNNIVGGSVVSGYQSRYAVNNPTGANVIPIRIHPMLPAGTLFFDLDTVPYANSRAEFARAVFVQRDYYGIEWPLQTRAWQWGTYAHEVLAHNFPWMTAVITGIGPFAQSN